MDENSVTKQDLLDLEARLESNLEARMTALIEKSETNLLRAFHGWARTMEIRVRGAGTSISGFDERLALAEERIAELERKSAS